MTLEKSAGIEYSPKLAVDHLPQAPSDHPPLGGNEVAHASTNLSSSSFGSDTSLDLIRNAGASSVNELPKSFAPVTIAQDGSLTFDAPNLNRIESTERQEQVPEAPILRQPALDAIENEIDHNPKAVIRTLPDGSVYKADDDNRVITRPDGTKEYSSFADGISSNVTVRPDGSFTSNQRGPGGNIRIDAAADGSTTQVSDTPDTHVSSQWGPGGEFKQRITTDKKTGKVFVTKPGPNGELVTEQLPQA